MSDHRPGRPNEPTDPIAAPIEDWGFSDPGDAAEYLGVVARIWAFWLLGMIALFVFGGFAVLVIAVGLIGGLLWMARPLQARAQALVPDNSLVVGRGSLVLGRGTTRDRALRKFAYGDAPVRQAVEMTGGSPLWMVARRLVVVATLVAFAILLIQSFGAA